MKRGPKPINGATMTPAERQARYRAAHQADAPKVKVKFRQPADRRSRPQRWRDAVAELIELQANYQAWRDALPENLEGSVIAEALDTVCDFDLTELAEIVPPRGFGRD